MYLRYKYTRTHNQHSTTNNKQHINKTPAPWTPLVPSFQRLQINRWVWLPNVAGGVQSPQHNNAMFLCETVSLFYWLLFCRSLSSKLTDKRHVFLVNICAFLLTVASIESTCTISAVCRYFFANVSPILIMFWCDFGQKREGGGTMVTMFPRGVWYLVALSLFVLIKVKNRDVGSYT